MSLFSELYHRLTTLFYGILKAIAMNPSFPQLFAAFCFLAALVHSLNAPKFARLALHQLSEIEIIFGLYAFIYSLGVFISLGASEAIQRIETLNFSEAVFIVVIMVTAATRPILNLASRGIEALAEHLPFPGLVARYSTVLIVGPLIGSLITEPAAMSLTALLLHQTILPSKTSKKLFYSTLAVLFVNVSIGGVLTSFAAPPVLMVARTWEWNSAFMFTHFGWKAVLAILLNTFVLVCANLTELSSAPLFIREKPPLPPLPIQAGNLFFLFLCIAVAHHPVLLIAGFLIFYEYLGMSRKYQGDIQLRPAILVGLFLASLVVLTAEQGWWLNPVLTSANDFMLYLSTAALTSITDNAAITSLAAQVPNLSSSAKQAILSGAVVGGGLTLIANAPNPAGFSILKTRLAGDFSAAQLFLWAIPFTFISGALLWIH